MPARAWVSAKYETRHGDPNALDVPPGVHANMLGDPHEPLWITEGVKKGDCCAARGLCIVDVSGVWNWRGRNRLGGKVALPDWNEIALSGRQVIICYDGDTQRKRQVRQAPRRRVRRRIVARRDTAVSASDTPSRHARGDPRP